MPSPPPHWPYVAQSRLIAHPPHRWHVQDIGAGPILLLLHGAGGATHSWRNLIPLLPGYRILALDLPGQGFTALGSKDRCGLDAMAEDIAALCTAKGWQPAAVIGHSAGHAIALRLADLLPVPCTIGINSALGKFEGLSGLVFPAMAKLLSATPFFPNLFSRLSATPAQVHRLITSTGSTIDAVGEAQYLSLMRMVTHVDATLAMMAQWNLDALLASLPHHRTPCLLITADGDLAVPAKVSAQAAQQMPQATWAALPRHGHLVHEEAAAEVAPLILNFLQQT